MSGTIHLGTQGWNYDAWVGPFYPSGTKPGDFLSMYARAFDTVEVDSTFYAIPPVKTVRGWAARTPAGFVFALKLPQEITHERRLRDAGDLLVQFLDAARELGPKLGPILVQLGPDFGPGELPALAAFLPLLPPDLDFAVEFRQRKWINEGVLALLKEHRVALAVTDGKWIPRNTMLELLAKPTSTFSYVRLMGPDRSFVDYSRVQADRSRENGLWSDAAKAMLNLVVKTFFYVNNHYSGHSPATVRELRAAFGLNVVPPDRMGEQLTLL